MNEDLKSLLLLTTELFEQPPVLNARTSGNLFQDSLHDIKLIKITYLLDLFVLFRVGANLLVVC